MSYDRHGRVADRAAARAGSAIATSGRPAGASGMSRLPSAASSIAAIDDRADARAGRVARAATSAPIERAEPADAAITPIDGRVELRARRSTNRNHVAPKMPHSAARRHLRAGEAAQDRVVDDEPEAVADLVEHRLAVRGRRRRRLGSPDRPEQDGRDHERDGVDERSRSVRSAAGRGTRDAERRRTRPPEPLAARALLASTSSLALDDRRQVGVVGGVEERRQDRGQRRPRRRPAGA